VEAGDSEEQQGLALLQREMLAFILEGVTERIERGEAPVLADAVAAAIARQVEAAIDSRVRDFDLPMATRIAEEVVRIARAEAETIVAPPPRAVSEGRPAHGASKVRDEGEGNRAQGPGWQRLAAVWLAVPLLLLLLLLLGLAGWFAWQKSSALKDEAATRTRIAVERDSLSGEICKSAKAQQEQLARLRKTGLYKANCPQQAGRLPDFCEAVDALDRASRPRAGCRL
jgi:hypothetical protein